MYISLETSFFGWWKFWAIDREALEQRFIHTKVDLPIQHTPRVHLGLKESWELSELPRLTNVSCQQFPQRFHIWPEDTIEALLQQVLR